MILTWKKWKVRFIGWLRDAILILGMWSIWLIHEYVVHDGIMIILTIFQVTIIIIVVLIKEYIVSSNEAADALERELETLKNKH